MTRLKKSNNISVNCYTIRFNEKSQKKAIKIKDVFTPNDFKSEMHHFLGTYEQYAYTNEEEDRILYLSEILSLGVDVMSGVMKRGHNGQESDIDEMIGGKPNTISSVKPDQFNSIYFYFLITLPNPESDFLIFIAQTYKQFGFKDLFTESYKKYIESRYKSKYNCSINPLSIPKLFSKYIKEGDIRKLRFRSHKLTTNAENLLSNDDNKNIKDYEVELSVRAKKKGFTGIKNIDFETTAFVELYDLGFPYDDAFADVSVHGRIRTINITNPEKFTATYDITDRVGLQPDTQRPVYKDLNKEALKILKEEILPNI